ncbi:MAG: metallophosphoesterase family protein [Candidatus Komeilibacteria bacterium]|nr:metallophosphoesterase family protein [Candidatus Komeilibacteria bacterium]
MKVAVISDIHDNEVNLTKVLTFCEQQKIEQIICCGDVASSETLTQLAKFAGTIHLVFGNMDLDYHKQATLAKRWSNIILYQGVGEVMLAGKKIAFVHEPIKIKQYLQETKIKPEIIFHGHTHKPWTENISGVQVVGPGNVANIWYAPTFALFDLQTSQLELIMINQL